MVSHFSKRGDTLTQIFGGELARLFRAVPKPVLSSVEGTGEVKDLRDRALLALMGLQGLRTVETWRANVEDLKEQGETKALLVRGKTRDRLAYLRPDVIEALLSSLKAQATVGAEQAGTPLFTALGNRAGGQRLSRRGIRQVVDFYLREAGLKRPGVSDHALRHTAATLAYKYTRDLRAVQDRVFSPSVFPFL